MMFFSFFNILKSLYSNINKIFEKKFIILIILYLNNIFIYTNKLAYIYVKAIN